MCGIGAFSLSAEAQAMGVSRKIAKAILLDIESRGQDATGFAFVDKTGSTQIHKRNVTATAFVRENLTMPKNCGLAVLHTRAWTTGDPIRNENNHPIKQGSITGVHNGWIVNDDMLWATLLDDKLRMAEVDSEVIFALLAHGNERSGMTATDALSAIEGPAAVAWIDSDFGGHLFLARAWSNPLVVGQTEDGSVIAASTESAVTSAAAEAGLVLTHIRVPEEGTMMTVVDGTIGDVSTFTPTGPYPTKSKNNYGWNNYGYNNDDYTWPRIGATVPAPSGRGTVSERMQQAVDTFTNEIAAPFCSAGWENEEEDLYPSPETVSDIDTFWMSRDTFDMSEPVELAGCSESVHIQNYGTREKAIDNWMAGFGTGTDMTVSMRAASEAKAFVRAGTNVTTTIAGMRNQAAQIVSLPATFPAGKYVLRALIPKLAYSSLSSPKEVVLLERSGSEFSVVPTQMSMEGMAIHGSALVAASTNKVTNSIAKSEPKLKAVK